MASRTTRQYSKTFLSYAVLAIAYIVLNLIIPISKTTEATYHLNDAQYRILAFTYILPLVGIWFAAFYGYEKLREYSAVLKRTHEGRGFSQITIGAMWFAWGLPMSTILSAVLNAAALHYPHHEGIFIVISNYIAMIITLGAFTAIGHGTHMLTEGSNLRPGRRGIQVIMLSFISLGVLYCYLTIRSISSSAVGHNPYHMPLWLILFTLIVPYLYAWFMGLFAAYEINLYSRYSKGVLYRQALQLLAAGITTIIASSITIQYVTSVKPTLNHLTLGSLLILIYVLLIVYAAGYVIMAAGARKLKKIEEV